MSIGDEQTVEKSQECHRKGRRSDRGGSRVGQKCQREGRRLDRGGSRLTWVQGRRGKYSQKEYRTENTEQQCGEEEH